MCRSKINQFFKILATLGLLSMGLISSVAIAKTAIFSTVVSGLSEPRGLDIDSKGNLYASIAGSGDPTAYPSRSFALSRSIIEGPMCPGHAGKIIKVDKKNNVTTVLDNFWDEAACMDYDAGFGIPIVKGSLGIGLYGMRVFDDIFGDTFLFTTVNESNESLDSACLPGGAIVNSGPPQTTSCKPGFSPPNPADYVGTQKLIYGQDFGVVDTFGVVLVNPLIIPKPQYWVISDKFKYIEQATNPDAINTAGPFLFPFPTRTEVDPVAVLLYKGQFIIVDAGANVIWTVDVLGNTKVALVMPNVGCSAAPCTPASTGGGSNLQESVPTAIAQNPVTGNIYVGEYANQLANSTRIFQLVPPKDGSSSWSLNQVTLSGDLTAFSGILGMDFDNKGNLYTVEYAQPPGGYAKNAKGRFAKLKFSTATTASVSIIDDTTLVSPTGLTVGNGKVYISNNGDSGPGQGQIVSWTIP